MLENLENFFFFFLHWKWIHHIHVFILYTVQQTVKVTNRKEQIATTWHFALHVLWELIKGTKMSPDLSIQNAAKSVLLGIDRSKREALSITGTILQVVSSFSLHEICPVERRKLCRYFWEKIKHWNVTRACKQCELNIDNSGRWLNVQTLIYDKEKGHLTGQNTAHTSTHLQDVCGSKWALWEDVYMHGETLKNNTTIRYSCIKKKQV